VLYTVDLVTLEAASAAVEAAASTGADTIVVRTASLDRTQALLTTNQLVDLATTAHRRGLAVVVEVPVDRCGGPSWVGADGGRTACPLPPIRAWIDGVDGLLLSHPGASTPGGVPARLRAAGALAHAAWPSKRLLAEAPPGVLPWDILGDGDEPLLDGVTDPVGSQRMREAPYLADPAPLLGWLDTLQSQGILHRTLTTFEWASSVSPGHPVDAFEARFSSPEIVSAALALMLPGTPMLAPPPADGLPDPTLRAVLPWLACVRRDLQGFAGAPVPTSAPSVLAWYLDGAEGAAILVANLSEADAADVRVDAAGGFRELRTDTGVDAGEGLRIPSLEGHGWRIYGWEVGGACGPLEASSPGPGDGTPIPPGAPTGAAPLA
jgi:hypothetical protein